MGNKKPRIVIDARMAGPHGFGRYVGDLAEALAAEPRPYEILYLLARELPATHFLRKLPHTESRIPFLHPAEAVTLGGEIRRLEPELFHSPSFMSLGRYPCPHIQTVHDLNHLRFGGMLQRAYYHSLLKPSAKKARVLVTVSESARAELTSWLGRSDIRLARNAIARKHPGDPSRLARFDLQPGGYFACVSNSKPHKNLKCLERAYVAAKRERPDLPPLAITANGPAAEGIQRIGTLIEEDLDSLFAHARAFFFPSLYEGFGRPPLEAALLGTLPVASDIPPHREALRGVPEVRFLDPENESAWTRAFLAPDFGRVGDTSRAWIETTYSVRQLGKAMDAIYREALSL